MGFSPAPRVDRNLVYVPMCPTWLTGRMLAGSGSRTSLLQTSGLLPRPPLNENRFVLFRSSQTLQSCLTDSLLLLHTQPDFIQLLWNVMTSGSIQLTLHRVKSVPGTVGAKMVPHEKCSART